MNTTKTFTEQCRDFTQSEVAAGRMTQAQADEMMSKAFQAEQQQAQSNTDRQCTSDGFDM